MKKTGNTNKSTEMNEKECQKLGDLIFCYIASLDDTLKMYTPEAIMRILTYLCLKNNQTVEQSVEKVSEKIKFYYQVYEKALKENQND